MSDRNYVECEWGACGETRPLRVVGDGIPTGRLQRIAAEIVRRLCDEAVGLPNTKDLKMTATEQGVVAAVGSCLDSVLSCAGLPPRHLTPGLYHILSRREFERRLGKVSGAVRNGHAYLRRASNDIEILSQFLPCVCHESVHLSAAIVVRVDGERAIGMRDGLMVVENDGSVSFVGLNESVTDFAANLVGTAVCRMLGCLDDGPSDMRSLIGCVSAYSLHEIAVNRVCRRLFPESFGAEGWRILLNDYWGGSEDFFVLLSRQWPEAYAVLRSMGAQEVGVRYALETLNLT